MRSNFQFYNQNKWNLKRNVRGGANPIGLAGNSLTSHRSMPTSARIICMTRITPHVKRHAQLRADGTEHNGLKIVCAFCIFDLLGTETASNTSCQTSCATLRVVIRPAPTAKTKREESEEPKEGNLPCMRRVFRRAKMKRECKSFSRLTPTAKHHAQLRADGNQTQWIEDCLRGLFVSTGSCQE